MARNYSKQSGGWATGLKNNIFLWARLKLTFVYLIIIAAILSAFSIGLYFSVSKNSKDTINEKFKDHALRPAAIEDMEMQLRYVLIVGNTILLFFSGGLAFFLAGKNLRPIQNALEKQKRFTANASHDLRTPLTIMKIDNEIKLKKKEISSLESRELIKSNLEEVNRMSEMVEQLLFLSRNNNLLNPEMEKVSLTKIIKNATNSFKILAGEKKITLDFSLTEGVSIKGNKLDLEKVISNLIKNAIDYTQVGGKINVLIEKDKNFIKLTVKDNGIGISPDDLPNVTEPFYKADKNRNGQNKGSGLGLSIVEEIVKNHLGKMEIKSQLGKGTEVIIFFPIIN